MWHYVEHMAHCRVKKCPPHLKRGGYFFMLGKNLNLMTLPVSVPFLYQSFWSNFFQKVGGFQGGVLRSYSSCGVPEEMIFFTFFSNFTLGSMTMWPQPQHLIRKSMPVLKISHWAEPQGWLFFICTISPTEKSINYASFTRCTTC